ncbi:MAG: hypothetical protein M3Q48_17255 [Actinomycetota bacterium]|nr:hypothetical protein [Actinomycetota bacterium]
MSQVDVDVVSAAVERCPTVASLSGGELGEVATYLPGRKVSGVRVRDNRVELHLVTRWGVAVPDLESDVRAAVAPLVGNRAVDIHVDDLEVPEQAPGG